MSGFLVLCVVMFVFSLVRASRNPVRRGIHLSQAAGWGLASLGKLWEAQWLYVPAGVFLVIGLVLALTWKRRMLNEIRDLAGITPEDEAELEREEAEREARREAREKEETLVQARAEAEAIDYRVEAREGPIRFTVSLPSRVEFPVETGGSLRFEPGSAELELAARLADVESDEQPVEFRTRVADGEGGAWECTTLFEAASFLGTIIGHSEEDCPSLVSWKEAPESWRRCLREHTLVAGAGDLMDSRDGYALKIDGEVHTILEKYQGPEVDLAWNPDDGVFLVRVDRLYGVTEEDPMVDLPAFVFPLEPEQVALLTCSEKHWTRFEEWLDWDEEEVDSRERPVFRRGEKEGADLAPSAIRLPVA